MLGCTLRVAAGTVILSTWTLSTAALAGDQEMNEAVPESAPITQCGPVQHAVARETEPGRIRLTSLSEPQAEPQHAVASQPAQQAVVQPPAAQQPAQQAAAKPGASQGPVNQTNYDYPPQYHVNYHLSGVTTHIAHPVTAPYWLPPDAANVTPTGYPFTNAPLYPTPLPNIPYQVGATVLTNQALYPHEMLYAHTYRALYPPYFYEVHGGWKVMPWGVTNVEHWKLRGTLVTVKYHSSIKLFSGFVPGVFPFVPFDANPMGSVKNNQDPAYAIHW
jgi:hypothetical protein